MLKQGAATKALLVVKANAYGHGLLRMASEAVAAGMDMLGVATIGEAEELIESGLSAPVLIMCALDDREIEFCVARDVHFFAWRAEHFDQAAAAADKYGSKPKIHIEVDTGMSRSGVDRSDFADLIGSLTPRKRDSIVGVSSHFHSADLECLDSAAWQLKEFLECVDIARAMGLAPLTHIANSPASIRLPVSRLDMVRLGVAAYGLAPSEYTALPAGLGPVLSWMARVTNVKTIPAGRGVGYGWRYVADRAERVATLGIGYADGYHRSPPGVNSVLIGGVEAPVVGSVFMDQCVFVVPENVCCAVGDTAVLIGRQGAKALTADDLAERWMTNSYDVVAGIRTRVPR
ncbi:MAG: alanine racemase, partial [Gammaproteobacteria bacterium]